MTNFNLMAQMDGNQNLPPFMQGWTEDQIREFYQKQRDTQMRNNQQMQNQEARQQMYQQTGAAFDTLNQKLDERNQKRLEAAANAANNMKVGFGNVSMIIESRKFHKNSTIVLPLGTTDHRFGCYTNGGELVLEAKKNVSGIVNFIKIVVGNYGQKNSETLNITVKNDIVDAVMNIPQGRFSTSGTYQRGQISVSTPQLFGLNIIKSVGEIRFWGCAKDQAPPMPNSQNGQSGGNYY